MTYNGLKRKKPLKSKVGFKPRQPRDNGLAKGKAKSPSDSGRTPNKKRGTAKSSLETHLDIVFSLYIRLRDAMDGGMAKCISCGRVFPFESIQCGHFFGRSNHSTRWDEDNCNAECVRCNCFDDSHLEGYARNLIVKIGKERYDSLCVRARQARKWSGDELRGLIRHYTEEVKRLGKEKGVRVRI